MVLKIMKTTVSRFVKVYLLSILFFLHVRAFYENTQTRHEKHDVYGVYAHEERNNHWVRYFSINLESDSVCEKTDDKLLKTVLFFPVH